MSDKATFTESSYNDARYIETKDDVVTASSRVLESIDLARSSIFPDDLSLSLDWWRVLPTGASHPSS